MSQIRTYIFGNPAGWSLYEGDPAELDYFKSFYRNDRHGIRMMVNRRDDGSVVYTYVNYGLKEGSDRCGDAHFGMALILENGQYTPAFNTIFRFMHTLFVKSMERPDALFVQDHNGSIRYAVEKFDTRRNTVEWFKATLPRILERTGINSIYSDPNFKEAPAGRIATFPDEETDSTTTDANILNGFYASNWVSVSPEYKPKANSTPSRPEIYLQDLEKLRNFLTAEFLKVSTGQISLSRQQLDKMCDTINNARMVLSDYIESNPTDIEAATKCRTEFSELLSTAYILTDKLNSAPTQPYPPTPKPKPTPTPPSPEPRPKPNQAPNPDRMAKLIAAAVVAMIVIVAGVWGISSLRSDSTGGETDPIPTLQFNEQQFNLYISTKHFAEAYRMIAGQPEEAEYKSKLYNAVIRHLKSNIESGRLADIELFVTDNKESLEYLGFPSSSNEYVELSTILKEKEITPDQFSLAQTLIQRLGDTFDQYTTELQSRIKQPQAIVYPTIKLNGKNQQNKQSVKYTVTVGQDYTISSTETIKLSAGNWATPKDGTKKVWNIKISEPGSYNLTSGNTSITITATQTTTHTQSKKRDSLN